MDDAHVDTRNLPSLHSRDRGGPGNIEPINMDIVMKVNGWYNSFDKFHSFLVDIEPTTF